MNNLYLGIDLGGTTVKFGVVDNTGNIKEQWNIPTNIEDHGSHILPDMINSIKNRLPKYKEQGDQILGIGMGTPGSVDPYKGTVTGAYNLNWTEEQLLKEEFETNFKIPFFIENDANVAALGERWVGAGENENDVVFVTIGTGIGGGIIANGKLVRGVAGSGGEIGHIVVKPDGDACTCGSRGCLETIASASGIAKVGKVIAKKHLDSELYKASKEDNFDAKIVFDLAKSGDQAAIEAVEDVTYYLAWGLGQVADILNPQYIVIGGGVSAAGNFLLDYINNFFPNFVFPNVKKSTSLRLAQLGNDAGILGAASLVRENLKEL
ncbi:ROK family glucokinase [Xylocopilactobacillus apis]|uniref:Glucokinase n=1 Tax=Xylocopilactobacillus apis TaxID=2932183 RepID=A0AAU9CV98_9LACO|nr:ROK family glucokinase [Xylocopilactobacillus apis]BDR56316.1 glucokinase [Xylocopilactobacillus apis]